MVFSKGAFQEPHKRIEPENGKEEFNKEVIVGVSLLNMDYLMIDDIGAIRFLSHCVMQINGPEEGKRGYGLPGINNGISFSH